MAGEDVMDEGAPETTGAQLRRAREAAGLSLADVSATTRIRLSHLQALEEGKLSALPGRTYAIGFARSYARAVGLDEAAIALSVRTDLGDVAPPPETSGTAAFTPGDPARVPSARFAWIAAGAAALIGAGGFALWHGHDNSSASLPSLLPEATATATPGTKAAPALAAASNQVVFTAQAAGVRVKLYDAAGQQLFEKQLAQGESFAVPVAAKDPMLSTGSPEALAITIGGRPVAKLADSHTTVKDVRVSATALLARVAPAAVTAPAGPVQSGLPQSGIATPTASQPAARPKLTSAASAHKVKIDTRAAASADAGNSARLGGVLPSPVPAGVAADKPGDAPAEAKPAPATP